MPERDIITIGELRAETPTPAGIINPTDLMEAFRPDNPSGPGADGNSYGGTFAELAAFVLGNISVIENANGTSIRIPGPNLQICFHAVNLQSTQAPYIEGGWVFPKPFGAIPEVVGIIQLTGSSVAPGSSELGSVTRTNRGSSGVNLRVHRTGSTNFVSGNNLMVNAVAIGRY